MPKVIVTVPIELVKEGDQYSLLIRNDAGHECLVPLDTIGETPLEWSIVLSWADQHFQKALLKRRRATGVEDIDGRPIMEGDILFLPGDDYVGRGMHAAVKWNAKVAAFILEGRSPATGGVWQTPNLQEARNYRVVGNVFEQPELLDVPKAA